MRKHGETQDENHRKERKTSVVRKARSRRTSPPADVCGMGVDLLKRLFPGKGDLPSSVEVAKVVKSPMTRATEGWRLHNRTSGVGNIRRAEENCSS